jgi:XTP/dITP diphosphohydrolase
MRKIVIASGNQGKVDEIRQIMQGLDYLFVTMKEAFGYVPDIEENGATFYENALLKAEFVYNKCGFWTLADDSGLEVDALGGMPGVHSARFAGIEAGSSQNNRKLLDLLENVPDKQRSARFRCIMVLKTGNDSLITAEGVCEGRILRVISGSGGFGYDPLFVPSGYDHSFGELSNEIKNSISHRSSALARLRQKMELLND